MAEPTTKPVDQASRTKSEPSLRLRLTRWLWRIAGDIMWLRTSWRFKVNGLENIPRSGPTILLFNHVTFFDPVAAALGIRFRATVPITKQELNNNIVMRVVLWGWHVIPIQRGEMDRAALKLAIEVIHSSQILMIAPEGTRHKRGLRDPKEGIAMLSRMTGAVLVPAGISGTENYLHNLKRLRRTPITVNYGRALRLKDGITSKQYTQVADEVMYQLAALIDPHLRGNYSELSKATMTTIDYA